MNIKTGVFFLILFSISLCRVPQTLTEAEDMLYNGDIDSTFFLQYEDLLFNPINPINEGWRRLKSLTKNDNLREFPSINTTKAIINSGGLDSLFIVYPWLSEYSLLISTAQKISVSPINGAISTSIVKRNDTIPAYGYINSSIFNRDNTIGGELKLGYKNNQLKVNRRAFTVDKSGIDLTVGNFYPINRNLIYGYFSNHKYNYSIGDEFLYSRSIGWNGINANISVKRVTIEAILHKNITSHLEQLVASYTINDLSFGIGGSFQEANNQSIIVSTRYRDNILEFTYLLNKSYSLSLTGNSPLNKRLFSLGNMWYISPMYNLPLSPVCHNLYYRYKRIYGKAYGGDIKLYINFNKQCYLKGEFIGEKYYKLGEIQSSLNLILKSPFYISLYSEFKRSVRYNNIKSANINTLFFRPRIKNISFPLGYSIFITNSFYEKSKISEGIIVKYKTITNELYFYQNVSLLEKEYKGKLYISNKIGKRGESTFKLGFPMNNKNSFDFAGKVTIFL